MNNSLFIGLLIESDSGILPVLPYLIGHTIDDLGSRIGGIYRLRRKIAALIGPLFYSVGPCLFFVSPQSHHAVNHLVQLRTTGNARLVLCIEVHEDALSFSFTVFLFCLPAKVFGRGIAAALRRFRPVIFVDLLLRAGQPVRRETFHGLASFLVPGKVIVRLAQKDSSCRRLSGSFRTVLEIFENVVAVVALGAVNVFRLRGVFT